MNIGTFILTIVTTVSQAWVAGKSELDNILDVAIAILSQLKGSFAAFLLAIVSRTEAGLSNLNNGQAAVLVTESINGTDYTAVIVKNNSAAGAALGLGTDPGASS